jgi:hypothetical protein
MSYTNQVITGDAPSEYGFAIGKASAEAKRSGEHIKIYSLAGMLWMTDIWIPDGAELVADCYPGGRNILHRREGA